MECHDFFRKNTIGEIIRQRYLYHGFKYFLKHIKKLKLHNFFAIKKLMQFLFSLNLRFPFSYDKDTTAILARV